MNTTQLECFMAVADFLNFSRAAEHLRLTQPAVSHQVRTLEDELGVALFRRTSKSVRLTQEGQLFLQYAGEILRTARISVTQVRQCRTSRPQKLGVGCRSAADLRLLRPALERLRREEPGVQPQLRLVPSGSLDNLLAEGDVQVMFAFQEAIPKNASYQELVRCPMACVCRGDHPLAEAEELTLEELKGAGTIAACRPSACPPSLFAIQGQLVTTRPPEQVLFCDSQEVLFTLVETGYAFAVMADFPQLRRPGLRYLPLAEYPPLSYGAAWLGDSRAPALRRFLALLRDTL
ncbi:LysR substrate-binding domain-containing protein [Pseudoflavonifractor phocaeensis]|uniref:LysR substrate-binding domain-containing protein n=1 Tax=Pseudoflavonifractor phocaeensis TaxID=1870988 RepID=UPI00195CC0B0|nr:LysR family transcriptional regulator [Pseudoflavonifractor phocaeensis]